MFSGTGDAGSAWSGEDVTWVCERRIAVELRRGGAHFVVDLVHVR